MLQARGRRSDCLLLARVDGAGPGNRQDAMLQQANAFMGVARYLGFPLGAAAGGAIVATIGRGYALLVDGATYATSALLLSRIHLPGAARSTAAPNFARELREGWQAFTEHTWVWLLTLWISLYFLVTYAPFFVLGPYIAKNSLGGPEAWAIIVTGEALGALAGASSGSAYARAGRCVAIGALFMRHGVPVRAARSPCAGARDRRCRRSSPGSRSRSAR